MSKPTLVVEQDFVFNIQVQTPSQPIETPTRQVVVGQDSGRSTANFTLVVDQDGSPFLAIAVFVEAGHADCFREGIVWKESVVIGSGQSVSFVSLVDFNLKTFELDSYFGHLYPGPDRLLVATGDRLWCFDSQPQVVWQSEMLGLDGVIVHDLVGETIEGEGEWDPPDGWRSFRLWLATGERITPG